MDIQARLRNKSFWVAVFALVGLVVQDLGVIEVGRYETYVQAILLVLVAGGIIIDPRSKGLKDN